MIKLVFGSDPDPAAIAARVHKIIRCTLGCSIAFFILFGLAFLLARIL